MSDEPIPLFDGDPSGAKIIPEDRGGGTHSSTLRGRRRSARRCCENVSVCFSPQLSSGRIDHAACPVIDFSEVGIAIEYDRELEPGVSGHIDFRTISHRPVHVSCRVRRCAPMENGRYVLGLSFDRTLRLEERRPARVGPGRELAPGIRARKLGSKPLSS